MWVPLVGLALLSLASGGEVVVPTALGAIQGTAFDDARAFTGIPYAEPPTGTQRWRAPVPKVAWSPATIVANRTGVGCPQTCMLPPGKCPVTTSEDCLTLNVYTPLTPGEQPAAVMVFFPGGRFEQGLATAAFYDGRTFVNTTRTILVTASSRLGALGYLATGPTITGNYGFLDQNMALQWVHDNIAAFGGNPSDVTIFGQSAGAAGVACHLVSPLPANFRRAIVESDPLALSMKSPAEAAQLGARFAKALGCGPQDVTCLQSKTAAQIVAAQDATENHLFVSDPLGLFLPWTPVVDGKTLTGQPVDLLSRGVLPSSVDSVIMGTVADEGTMFIAMAFKKPMPSAEYAGILTAVFGPAKAAQVFEHYPCTSSDCRGVMANMTTPFIFTCATRYALRGIAKVLPSSSYMYYFDHVWSFAQQGWGPNYTFCDDEVCHGAELPFIFDSAQYAGITFTPQEQQLSELMMGFWGNFGTSGSPNTGAVTPAVSWPPLGPLGNQKYMFLATPSALETNLQDDVCDFWDRIGYNY